MWLSIFPRDHSNKVKSFGRQTALMSHPTKFYIYSKRNVFTNDLLTIFYVIVTHIHFFVIDRNGT